MKIIFMITYILSFISIISIIVNHHIDEFIDFMFKVQKLMQKILFSKIKSICLYFIRKVSLLTFLNLARILAYIQKSEYRFPEKVSTGTSRKRHFYHIENVHMIHTLCLSLGYKYGISAIYCNRNSF